MKKTKKKIKKTIVDYRPEPIYDYVLQFCVILAMIYWPLAGNSFLDGGYFSVFVIIYSALRIMLFEFAITNYKETIKLFFNKRNEYSFISLNYLIFDMCSFIYFVALFNQSGPIELYIPIKSLMGIIIGSIILRLIVRYNNKS